MPKQARGVSGFTLIELTIAIAVLVILVVVAIPQFVDYTHKGEDAAAQADGRRFLTDAVAASGASGDSDKSKSAAKTEGATNAKY